MITRTLLFLSRALPKPLTITVPEWFDWGHDFMNILPFVALVRPGSSLDDPCDIVHENVHTILALVSILFFALAGYLFPDTNGWIGGFIGLVIYWISNAVESWWPEQTAEAVEDLCNEEKEDTSPDSPIPPGV